MKPTNDLFEQQVRSKYEGYEVPAPASTMDAVFNELDLAKSGSFASKSLLIVASIITVGSIYMISDKPTQTESLESSTQIEQEVVDTEVLIEETTEEFDIIVEVEEPTTTEQTVDPVLVQETNVAQQNVISEEVVVAKKPAIVVDEIKEVAQPVEVVETKTPDVKEQKEEEKKKEKVEWVLPAKIKVEK